LAFLEAYNGLSQAPKSINTDSENVYANIPEETKHTTYSYG